jgi:small-conductance mechanosensitive channel
MQPLPSLRRTLALFSWPLLSLLLSANDAAAETTSSSLIAGGMARLQHHVQAIATALPEMPQYVADAGRTFGQAAGDTGVLRILLSAALCLIAGIVVEWLFRRGTRAVSARLAAQDATSVTERLTRLGVDSLIRVGAILAFGLGMVAMLAVENWPDAIREAGTALMAALLWFRIALAVLGILLRPAEGKARALAAFDLDVVEARFWYGHLGAFVGWFAFGWAIIATLRALRMPVPGLQFLAYVLGIGLVVIAITMVWRRPSAAATAGRIGLKAARWLASVAVVLFWLLWTVGAMYLFWLLFVLAFLPMAISAVRRAARHVMRPVTDSDGKPGLTSVAAVLVEQGVRALAILGSILILLWGWRLDVGSIAAQEDAVARLLRGGLHALIILLFADLAWHVVKALADNALANAQVATGVDAAEARRRARVRTLLPIGRNVVAIVLLVMAGLMALSALGVEIGPLIASAGVVGVAVGFGCQTVVRDIISGMFYMLDDAFRVGEYIQSGNYKGVVESFSLRSVKLRHHRGPLYTIPFGMLGAVQNMSRDWVIVKDQIGITYDSDVDRAKKLVKQIGQELAKDPDLGPSILQPLKMQGIEQFGDYSINIRLKMMCRPGEQFVVRRRANAMIKKAFDENGIKFAFPTVTLAGRGDDKEAAAAAPQVLKPAPAAH